MVPLTEDLFEKQNTSKLLTAYCNFQKYFATTKYIVWKK